MKKILLVTRPVCPPWDEASKNFAYSLAMHIKNFEMHLLSCGKLENLPSNVRTEKIYDSRNWSVKEKLECLFYQWRARKKYDITHYLFTATPLSSRLIEKFIDRSTVKTIQTIATVRDDLYSAEKLKIMFFADKLIVYSDYARHKLSKLGFQNVEKIYPGVDLEYFKPQLKDKAMLERYNIGSDDFVVMYPGEYARLGATDTITAAILKYFEKYGPESKIKFVFANRVKNEADRQKADELKKLFREKGLESQVVHTGTVFDMNRLYNLADVIIFPAENMNGKFDVPLAIIEAYACGKSVILSDLEVFKEFSHPDFSVTIRRGDATHLLSAIENLKNNPLQRETLGREARLFVEKNFNIEKNSRLYEEVYTSLLS